LPHIVASILVFAQGVRSRPEMPFRVPNRLAEIVILGFLHTLP
jgi:hypothetical protein